MIIANGKEHKMCGESEVQLHIGKFTSNQSVLVARWLTQECLLEVDFLLKYNCIIDLQQHQTLIIDSEKVK